MSKTDAKFNPLFYMVKMKTGIVTKATIPEPCDKITRYCAMPSFLVHHGVMAGSKVSVQMTTGRATMMKASDTTRPMCLRLY